MNMLYWWGNMAQNIGRSFTSLKAKKSQIKPQKKSQLERKPPRSARLIPHPPKKQSQLGKIKRASRRWSWESLIWPAELRGAPPGSFHRHSWHVWLATWSKSRSRVRLRPSERSESQRRSLRWRGRAVGLATVEQKRRKYNVLLLVLK